MAHTETPLLRDQRAIALLLASVLLITANNLISPALPGLAAAYADNPNAALIVRFLVPAPSLSVALFAPLAGRLTDRLGRRPMLCSGVVLFAITGVAGAFARDLYWLLAYRLLFGVAVAMVMTAQAALIGDFFSGGARQAFMGLQTSARNFGGLVFVLIGSALAAVAPQLPFAVYGMALPFLPLCLAITRTLIPIVPRPTEPENSGASPWLWPTLGLSAWLAVTTLLFFVIPTQIAFYAEHLGHFPPTATGFALGALLVTGGITALVYSRLAGRLGLYGTLAAGYALMALGFAAMQFAESLIALASAAALIGAGYAFVSPAFIALVLEVAPTERRGTATGIATTGLYLGQVTSPFVSQAVLAWTDWSGLFSGVAAGLGFLALLAIVFKYLRAQGGAARQT